VVIVEIYRKNFLASVVPVIVNAVLNTHHIVLDIVCFVSKGDFPRSRLGEKQRGKILSSWVTGKMRTIAQFGIRDPDLNEKLEDIGFRGSQIEGRSSKRRSSSLQRGNSNGQDSLNRNGTVSGSQKQPSMSGTSGYGPQISPTMDRSMQHLSITEDQFQEQSDFSVAGMPSASGDVPDDQRSETERGDFTPTDASQYEPSFPAPPIPSLLKPGDATLAEGFVPHTGITPPAAPDAMHYSPIDSRGPFSDDAMAPRHPLETSGFAAGRPFLTDPTAAVPPARSPEPPMPKYGSKPYLYGAGGAEPVPSPGARAAWGSLPSQQQQQQMYRGERPVSAIHNPQGAAAGGAQGYDGAAAAQSGLRVMNRNSAVSERSESSGHERAYQELGRAPVDRNMAEEEEWKRDAMAGLRLARHGGGAYHGI